MRQNSGRIQETRLSLRGVADDEAISIFGQRLLRSARNDNLTCCRVIGVLSHSPREFVIHNAALRGLFARKQILAALVRTLYSPVTNRMSSDSRPLRVVVLVLGDLGRSPRMQYHALALADSIADVDLIGYGGSVPLRTVLDHPHIQCHLLPDTALSLIHI